MLSIREDILNKINSFLEVKTIKKYILEFGILGRNTVKPGIKSFDACLILEVLGCVISKPTKLKYLLDMGDVGGYNIKISVVDYEDNTEVDHVKEDMYEIKIGNVNLEVHFIKNPETIKELFIPVKKIYEIINSWGIKVNDDTNDLLYSRRETLYINHNHTVNKHHAVCESRRGIECTMIINKCGVFLYYAGNIFKVFKDVPEELFGTVIDGDLYNKEFYGYDMMFYKGKNIQKYSLITRLKYLKSVSNCFSYCNRIEYYYKNIIKNVRGILDYKNGVIFTPVKANYMNKRTYIYCPVQNLGLDFIVEKNHDNYILKDLKDQIFMGTKRYPFYGRLALIDYDRKFIDNTKENVFEFRWDKGSLIPYKLSEKYQYDMNDQVWESINNPVDIDLILNKTI
jgi:hypothetical protein